MANQSGNDCPLAWRTRCSALTETNACSGKRDAGTVFITSAKSMSLRRCPAPITLLKNSPADCGKSIEVFSSPQPFQRLIL